MNISPARVAAFEALSKVEKERAFTSTVLPDLEKDLSQSDRALCHELVMGTLRRQFLADSYIDVLSGGKKIDTEVRIILRMALYQLMFLDRIPPHAAVDDAVDLTRAARKTSARGFVNAVLRAFLRSRPELRFTDGMHRLSVETSHPRWLLERWTAEFGADVAASIAKADNEAPEVSWRATVKNPKVPEGTQPAELRAMAERGEVYFQDRGSQLVASAVRVRPGDRVIDVCAAPGSKVTMLALGHQSDGTLFVAGDMNPSRLRVLAESVRLQGADRVSVVRYDATRPLPFADEAFDSVLVDAPCTGTGTIRHNPELRYLISETDISDLADKQLGILLNASKLVRPGGSLVYSTCSLEREENEGVCERFLGAGAGMKTVEASVPTQFLTGEGFFRTRPDRDRMDGFFLAAFEKV